MSAEYAKQMTQVAIAKVLQTLGFNGINSTPLHVLTDILSSYIMQMGQLTKQYANEYGCREPNLDHLGLAFRDFRINLADVQDYVRYVDFGQAPTSVPYFPVKKEDHLNFLKPGSKEVVTRPVHIHEHLPPMSLHSEGNFSLGTENTNDKPKNDEPEETTVETKAVFKRPADISPGEPYKRPRLLLEEEGRPTREISSVMMTTSGYLSPAREGKLPESRTPVPTVEPVVTSHIIPTTISDQIKKPGKIFKKIEKKKEKGVGKELFKALPELKAKKLTTMKDVVKLKQLKAVNSTSLAPTNNFVINNEVKIPPVTNIAKLSPPNNNKINKTLAIARLKTEKLNTTITPIPIKQASPVPPHIPGDTIDKLLAEPDKRKINIFKRISNVKNEKLENKIMKLKNDIQQESRESSPDLIIDESVEVLTKVHHISNDITIELINANVNVSKSPEKLEKSYYDDESPPGTPSTPKTPEMISQSPPLTKEKRKRKDKSKVKKVQKQSSPNRIDAENMEVDLERPKTPEAQVVLKPDLLPNSPPTLPFPFFPSFPGPGLIPPHLNNPLFHHLPMPGLPGFGQAPFIHPVHPGIPTNFMQPPPVKPEEPAPPKPDEEKPNTIIPNTVLQDEQDSPKSEKKTKEHKKEKKEKIKKKNKKDKNKDKSEKKKLKEEKKDKEKLKKEKKEKRKDKEREIEVIIPKITLKLGSPLPHPEPERKLNIKPIVRKEEEKVQDVQRELSPELAKISALVTGQPKPKNINIPKEDAVKDDTPVSLVGSPSRPHQGPGRPRIHSLKQKPTPNNNKQQVPVKDSEGNEVWICPACGRQDDGSPMIGCDDCDAWYHWVCVGIQVPPDDNEDWYCRLCIVKKQEVLQTDKKKKRKKRERKEH